ncbi:MAG: stress response translation initiation inhibitor YciH [Candidatus Korarchaeota archaeon]
MPGTVCPRCGLPTELCTCSDLMSKEGMTITISVENLKWSKVMTIISGLDRFDKSTLQQIVKELKTKLACGGTLKDGKIMLQGDHRRTVKKYLIEKHNINENQIVML